MTKISFVTGNRKKFEFILRNLSYPENIAFEQVKLQIDEIQAATFADVCKNKALQAWEQLQKPVLVHDSGMLIRELNDYPGPYTKDMLNTVGVSKIFELSTHFQNKYVAFEDCLTFVDADGVKQFTTDSGDLYCFSSRQSDQTLDDLPLNSIIAFSDNRDLPFSEMDDLNQVYKQKLKETGMETCWNLFSHFLSEKYNTKRNVA